MDGFERKDKLTFFYFYGLYLTCQPVFRIRIILMRIQIRGSASGMMDPDLGPVLDPDLGPILDPNPDPDPT